MSSREKLADVLEMQPPEGLGAKLRGLRQLKSMADSQPRRVRQRRLPGGRPARRARSTSAACPIQTCWPGDAAPFITLPAVITSDPRTGERNVGMYRLQVLGPRIDRACTGRSTRTAEPTTSRATGGMEVAVALGLDPITAYSASAPLPSTSTS